MEPHTAKALVDYLNSMRFMLRVEVEDLTGALVVQTLAGPLPAEGGVLSRTESADSAAATLREDGLAAAVTWNPFGIDVIVPADAAGKLAASFPVAGLWAFEAARIAARVAAAGPRHRPQDPAARDRPDRLRRAPEQGLLPRPGDGRADP